MQQLELISPESEKLAEWPELVKARQERLRLLAERYRRDGRSEAEVQRVVQMVARNFRHGHTINLATSATHNSWRAMIQRCLYSKHCAYQRYKGLGICERWMQFQNFLQDMGERPPNRTLDRIDNSKGYFKENCRWATRKEQAENHRCVVWLELNGIRLTQTDWSKRTGIGMTTICWRLSRGWSVERTLTQPVRKMTFK